MKRRYKGLFGPQARRRCPHSALIGIYGDEINSCGGYRLYCEDCDRFLDGPVLLTSNRYCERGTRPGIQYIDWNEYKYWIETSQKRVIKCNRLEKFMKQNRSDHGESTHPQGDRESS